MAGPMYQRSPRPTNSSDASVVNTSRLWGGGLATAAVAALVAFAGVLLMRGVFDIDLLSPKGEGTLGNSATAAYVVVAGIGALVATLILQILVLTTPRPLSFFSWIAGLVTVIFTVVPFTTDADLSSQAATAGINLAIGLVIVILLPQIGYSALETDEEPGAGPGMM
ncbi:MAG TPA: DUF6069 family protein [Streptosporangiaceae bacterium]